MSYQITPVNLYTAEGEKHQKLGLQAHCTDRYGQHHDVLMSHTVTREFAQTIIQPHELLNVFDERFIETRHRCNYGKGSILIYGSLGHHNIFHEDHKVEVWGYTTTTGQYKTAIGVTYTRMLCENQLNGLFDGGQGYFWASKHSSLQHSIEQITCLMDELPIYLRNYAQQREQRADTRLSLPDFILFMKNALDTRQQWDKDKVSNLTRAITRAWTDPTNTNLPPSVERAAQTITWLSSRGINFDGTKSRIRTLEGQRLNDDKVVKLITQLEAAA